MGFRLLQGAESEKQAQEVLREHLSQTGPLTGAMTVVIQNYRKDGTGFLNLLQMHPVISEGAVIQWIGVQHDVSRAKRFYHIKPQLQQMLECTKRLILILQEGHRIFAQLLGEVTIIIASRALKRFAKMPVL